MCITWDIGSRCISFQSKVAQEIFMLHKYYQLHFWWNFGFWNLGGKTHRKTQWPGVGLLGGPRDHTATLGHRPTLQHTHPYPHPHSWAGQATRGMVCSLQKAIEYYFRFSPKVFQSFLRKGLLKAAASLWRGCGVQASCTRLQVSQVW